MSAFWMAMPYAMIGIGEVLVNPVLQHYAYEGAPESMRSMLQAFNLFAMGGMPNAVSSALTLTTKALTPNNLNRGNLEVVYYINAGLGLVGCGLYYLVSHDTASAKSQDEETSDSSAGEESSWAPDEDDNGGG
mmetsp:Transcript_44822/g.101477  ORF Transcript_44822/g.101477 Transcript_44822/m.101477 type:complete len:133 (-) Transcript_44822:14-412(-)